MLETVGMGWNHQFLALRPIMLGVVAVLVAVLVALLLEMVVLVEAVQGKALQDQRRHKPVSQGHPTQGVEAVVAKLEEVMVAMVVPA
jgi:hypothetical protein